MPRTSAKPGRAPATDDFAGALLGWYDRHGRKDLPWQHDRSPYRVWVSEIMLQQTRVGSVIEYYRRFMERFPDVGALAEAPLDEVLHLWSGLGYYARARNLHRAAAIIRDDHQGRFPESFDDVAALPGIGRSTAGAILTLACGQRHAILDGNVKRVLARFHGIDGWPGRGSVARRLWSLAEAHTPRRRADDYTQAIMDLGATVCVRGRALCQACPVADACAARRQGRVGQLPTPKPRKQLPVRATCMLIIRNDDGAVLLEQRPPTGIWGGLWSLPECPPDRDPRQWCRERYGCEAELLARGASMRHTFSHFHLDISPVSMRARRAAAAVMDDGRQVWYNSAESERRGLAAPVLRLLQAAETESREE
ncbi:MAG: A/G-specific adenine glycosylase [Gammaproteobacteria bacterium]